MVFLVALGRAHMEGLAPLGVANGSKLGHKIVYLINNRWDIADEAGAMGEECGGDCVCVGRVENGQVVNLREIRSQKKRLRNMVITVRSFDQGFLVGS